MSFRSFDLNYMLTHLSLGSNSSQLICVINDWYTSVIIFISFKFINLLEP